MILRCSRFFCGSVDSYIGRMSVSDVQIAGAIKCHGVRQTDTMGNRPYHRATAGRVNSYIFVRVTRICHVQAHTRRVG